MTGNDGHEDAWTITRSECVELHERGRGIEREGCIQFPNTEQEEDGGDESKHACSDRTHDKFSTGNNTVVAN
jgi:hypothetical protein